MKKLFVLASLAPDAVVCAALLAGVCAELPAARTDVHRFWRIATM